MVKLDLKGIEQEISNFKNKFNHIINSFRIIKFQKGMKSIFPSINENFIEF